MQWFNDLALSKKLLIVLTATVLLALVIGYSGYQGIHQVKASADMLYREELVPIGEVGQMGKDFQRIRANLAFLMLATTQQEADHDRQVVINLTREMDTLSDSFKRAILPGEMTEVFGKYEQARGVFLPLQNRILALLQTGDKKGAEGTFLNDARASEHEIESTIDRLRELKRQSAEATLHENQTVAETSTIVVVVALIAAIALSVVLTLWVARLIARPLRTLGQVLETLADDNISLTENAGRIAAGDTSCRIATRRNEVLIRQNDEVGRLAVSAKRIVDSQEQLAASFSKVIETLDALISETVALSRAAVDGKLSVRGDIGKFDGGYREIVSGINGTLDAVIGPLNVAARYVDALSKGNIPDKIVDAYNGDFNTIKNNLNLCIDAIERLSADATMLAGAAIEGRLTTRADASRHQGDYRAIVEGVNGTLDTLVGFLDAMPVPAMIIGKDFTVRYMNTVGAAVGKSTPARIMGTQCHDHFRTNDCKTEHCAAHQSMLRNIGASSETIARPAAGELEISYSTIPVRSRSGETIGAFEVISDQTEVRRQMKAAHALSSYQGEQAQHLAELLSKIADGDLAVSLEVGAGSEETAAARQQYVLITEALAHVVSAVQTLVADTRELVTSAVDGRLSTRADVGKHRGEYRTIVQGFNETLDAVIEPIQEGSAVLAQMAKGDLTVRMVGQYRGDHQALKESVNTVAGSLSTTLNEVAEAVAATAGASSEISSSTEEMAAGAQEQTSQTGEVASAVEEMAKTILENSKNAMTTAGVAKQAKQSAEQGGKVVAETVEGMRRIAGVVEKSAKTVQELGRSSDQIGDIVTVIDDIADQTNLLALNAAIEAARAGDQGRGFAVVADEVRKLAERTTSATKEIAGMINKIQQDTAGAVASMEEGTQQVAEGIELADKAGASLKEIVDVSQKVTDMVTQIASASEQQSSTSEQISKNVEAISSVAAQTASGTQQVARAAEDLNRLTESLERLIGQFTIGSGRQSNHSHQAPERRTVAGASSTSEAIRLAIPQ